MRLAIRAMLLAVVLAVSTTGAASELDDLMAEYNKPPPEPQDFFDVGSWRFKFTDAAIVLLTAILVGTSALQTGRVRQTIEQMRKTEERQLRAYIHVSEARTDGLRRAQVTIRNAGQTPAYDVVHKCWFGFKEHATVGDHSFGDSYRSRDTLGPDCVAVAAPKIAGDPTTDELKRIEVQLSEVYLIGLITYRDAFGIERSTKYRYIRPRINLAEAIDGMLFAACAEGNEAD